MKSPILIIFSYISIACSSLLASDQTVIAESSSAIPLKWTCEPQPYQKDIPALAMFEQPVHYNRDIAKLAQISELAALIKQAHPKTPDLIPLISLKDLARYLYTCSSNLGILFKKIWIDDITLSTKEHEALIQLCKNSKITIDNLPEDIKKDWHLHQCEEAACIATTSTSPSIRKFYNHKLVEAASSAFSQPASVTFFASGELGQEHTLLKNLAEKSVPVCAINLIDESYSNLICMLNRDVSKSYIEMSMDNSLPEQLQACRLNAAFYFNLWAKISLDKIKQDNPRKTIAEAQKEAHSIAFLTTLAFFSYARTHEEFFKRAHELHPEIKSIRIYRNANDYIHDCQKDASLRPDILTGCDFKYIESVEPDADWSACWHDYHNIQDFCLNPTSIACSLQTTECNKAILNILKPNAPTVERWIYRTTTDWHLLTERQTQLLDALENKNRLPVIQEESNRTLSAAHILPISYEKMPTKSKLEATKELLAERDVLNNDLKTSYKLEINHG